MAKDYTTSEPWFGVWPPRTEEGETMGQDEPKGLWGRIFTRLNLILGGVTILGVLLVWKTIGFWHDMGIAFVISGILGLTIDNCLKKNLASEAVKAALGYVLPEPLKEEMRWVVGLKFLVIDHTAAYEIHANGDQHTVSVNVEVTRRIRNFTESTQHIKPHLSIDEMGIKGKPSGIDEFCYRLENHSWVYVDVGKTKRMGDYLELDAPKREKVPAGSWIETKYKFHEEKQINDVHFMVLTQATSKPNIVVHTDKGIGHREWFTHRIEYDETDTLKGTLLPYQSMYVRWWPIDGK